MRKSYVPTRKQIAEQPHDRYHVELWGFNWPPQKGWLNKLKRVSDIVHGDNQQYPEKQKYKKGHRHSPHRQNGI